MVKHGELFLLLLCFGGCTGIKSLNSGSTSVSGLPPSNVIRFDSNRQPLELTVNPPRVASGDPGLLPWQNKLRATHTIVLDKQFFSALQKMAKLNRLNLERCVIENPDFIPQVVSGSIRELELDSSSLPLIHRCNAFPNVEKISITSGVVSSSEIEFISVLSNLQVLDLRGAHIEPACLPSIRKLPSITTLIVFENAIRQEELENQVSLEIEVHKCEGGSI